MPFGKGFISYENSSDYISFDGDWFAGKFSNGNLIYKNGDSFNGSFKDGRKYKGKLTFADGDDLQTSIEARKTKLA
jgi:hypothetical protein